MAKYIEQIQYKTIFFLLNKIFLLVNFCEKAKQMKDKIYCIAKWTADCS